MNKKITAILLVIAIVASSFSRFFIYAGFELNRNYIATRLCENINRPWLHCNGKCYLMKKIKQAEDKQNAAERETQKNLLQEAYCQNDNTVKFYTHLIRVIHSPVNRIQLPQSHGTIFRPPQLA